VKLQLTARGYHRVLKVAQTIADLDGAAGVRRPHVAEALTYRRRAPGQAEGVQAGVLAR
jgi:magnesium chelatase family protein